MSKKKRTAKRKNSGKAVPAVSKAGLLGRIAAFAFASYMFAVFPLAYNNNFIDIQVAKYRAFVRGW